MQKQNNDFPRLLAKSLPKETDAKAYGAATYTGHTGCVMRAAEVLREYKVGYAKF